MLSGLFFLAALALGPSAPPAQEDARAEAVLSTTELLARDARLSFAADAAARARVVLESAPDEVEERAVAAMALGCAGAGADLPRLESMAADGKKPEQRAALFALGELGLTGLPALERGLERGLGGLEPALALALCVAETRGASAAGERLTALAAGEDELARGARAALVWRDTHEGAGLQAMLELYYNLRWRAAKSYGLVDGVRWQKAVAARLFADDEFLDRAILTAAAELSEPELKAHLTEMLLAGERPAALRVAALLMPDELALAFQGGGWKPTPEGWRVVLTTIEEERTERRARKLLEQAFQADPALEPLSGLLIFRAGGDLPWIWVGDQLEKGEPAQRAALVEACGDRGEKARIPDLADLLGRRKDLGLFGPGLVALARLGHAPAKDALDELVRGPASKERGEALVALSRVLHDPNLRRPAEKALELEDLTPDVKLQLELGLALSGARVERDKLRSLLPLAPRGPKRLGLVRALGEKPEHADLDALAALFPDEDDLELDVELARVLLRARHPAMAGLLRAALWDDDWNRSVLAGGLIVHSGGTQALRDELDSAPRGTREADLRRGGFALGEWGGLPAVEDLARTRTESDPVLQGALFGALSSRAVTPEMPKREHLPPGLAAGAGKAAGKAGGKAGAHPGAHPGGAGGAKPPGPKKGRKPGG